MFFECECPVAQCVDSVPGWLRQPPSSGKFLFVGEQKFYVRGVTYGPFRSNDSGCGFGAPETVVRDFAQMSANGINALRTYAVPPCWLLDAEQHGLHVRIRISE